VSGDFRSNIDVHMHAAAYADCYVCLGNFVVFCTKLPDLPCLFVPGISLYIEQVRLLVLVLVFLLGAGRYVHDNRWSALLRQLFMLTMMLQSVDF
jgi:hypothetical protein